MLLALMPIIPKNYVSRCEANDTQRLL